MKLPARATLFRVLFLLLAIAFGLYRVRVDYYDLDPSFVQLSPRGLLALAYYELGQYERASRAWRALYESSTIGSSGDPPDRTAAPVPSPSRAGDPLERADASFVARDFSEAASTYRAVLQRAPTSADAAIGLASALVLLGDHAGSLALFEDALNRSAVHERPVTLLNLLSALDALERVPARATTADRLLARTYVFRYLSIFDRRMLRRVLASADQALALEPTLAGAFVSKGVVYGKQGDYPRALEELTRAAALRPAADTYRRAAAAAGAIGRLREEIDGYTHAVDLEPGNPQNAYQLGRVLFRKYGDLHQAIEHLGRAYRLEPRDRSFALEYAYALEQRHRERDALEVYADVVRRRPQDQDALQQKARCLISLQRYREAIEVLLAARELGPLSFHAVRQLGFAYFSVKEFDQAIAAWETARRLKPYDVTTLYNLTALYRQRSRYREAHDAVRTILRIDPNHSGAQRILPYIERNLAR